MKFESKFGIGEIVSTRQIIRSGRIRPDELLEVIGVVFSKDKTPIYACRLPNMLPAYFDEHELTGDPTFNQETGEYPPQNDADILEIP